MKTIPRKTLRDALRKEFGDRQYRITGGACNEMVHIYGEMPNSHTVGWWLLGDIQQAELWLGFHNEVGT